MTSMILVLVVTFVLMLAASDLTASANRSFSVLFGCKIFERENPGGGWSKPLSLATCSRTSRLVNNSISELTSSGVTGVLVVTSCVVDSVDTNGSSRSRLTRMAMWERYVDPFSTPRTVTTASTTKKVTMRVRWRRKRGATKSRIEISEVLPACVRCAAVCFMALNSLHHQGSSDLSKTKRHLKTAWVIDSCRHSRSRARTCGRLRYDFPGHRPYRQAESLHPHLCSSRGEHPSNPPS